MNAPDTDPVVDAVVDGPTCPLCGARLHPAWPHLLCPPCRADEAEKWDDYRAEREQVWRPL